MGIFTGNKNQNEKEMHKYKVKYKDNSGKKYTTIVWATSKGEALSMVEGSFHAGK